jgi:hypothetical protein
VPLTTEQLLQQTTRLPSHWLWHSSKTANAAQEEAPAAVANEQKHTLATQQPIDCCGLTQNTT